MDGAMSWEPPSSPRVVIDDRLEEHLLAQIRAGLRRVRAPESLRARIGAMLAVERCLTTG